MAVRCVALAMTFVAVASGAFAHSSSGPAAGVQKVIQMLTDMEAKAKQEKKDEEVAFAKFAIWCSQESDALAGDIKNNDESIELLIAKIDKLTSDAASLGEAIVGLDSQVAKDEADQKASVLERTKDHEAFLVESKDYSESVDALDRAIEVLQKQNYDRTATKAMLLQVSRRERLPAKARSLITELMGMVGGAGSGKDDYMSSEAPQANAYEFQSTSIVELLKRLKDEFKTKLGECRKEEMNSKHAHEMVVLDLTDSIENARKEIGEKTVEKQRKAEKAALSKKQLAATTDVKAENKNTLKATTTECGEKKLSFGEKQKLRSEEIQAIGKAVEILSSPEVAGNAEKYLNLAQANKAGTALVQQGDSQASSRAEGIRRQMREFLRDEAARLRSQRLGLLAEQLAAGPFSKVKKMIDAMIKRLMEEANQDTQHEGFCDKEMGKSKITRTKLSEEIDGLTAASEDGKATIAMLADSSAELSKEVADLMASVAEATSLRKEEKATNSATVKDAQAAQAAVQAATAVLKDFYAKAGTATALVQAPSPRQWGLKTGVKMGTDEWNALANPDFKGTVDKGHKEGMQTFGDVEQGQQAESEYGVLALLQVIQSDFANLEADTKAAELASQEAYDQFMAESKKSQAVKERKIKMNDADKAAAESKLQEDTADLKSTQDELLAAERYYKNLVPQCIDQGMTFEERTKAREEEIASLKKALEILSSEDISTSA